MNEVWNFDRCVTVFSMEIELIKKIYKAQNHVRSTVLDMELSSLDEKTGEVKRLSEEFAVLEEERVVLFKALSNNSENSGNNAFYALISGLSLSEQRELSRLYRDLKMETLKMKALNDNFLAFLNEARVMANAYIEAVYPARGGKLYSKDGKPVSQDLKSMVVNSRF